MVGLSLYAITLFCTYIISGVVLYGYKKAWYYRTSVSVITIALLLNFSVVILFLNNLAVILLSLINIYAVFNLLIIIKNIYNPEKLYSITSRSFSRIAILQSLLFGLLLLSNEYKPALSQAQLLVVAFSALAIFAVFIALYASARLWQTIAYKQTKISFADLPTITVAIPARNEDEQLHSCLNSVIDDSYPKLEIIVYDDESQDNTAELIRQFARDGVRFIKGDQVTDEWLAKNLAYQKLLEQASGDIIFFMGTDIRLHKNSIQLSVEFMANEKLEMLCLMPIRTRMGILASFIQPMRYWWELSVPRLFPKRPPSLSSAWLVDRRTLLKIGGFTSFKRSITPEDHLAKIFASSGKYGFARSNKKLFVSTHKSFGDQWETATRTRYPQLHRRPDLLVLRVIFLLIILLPFVFLPLVIFSESFEHIKILTFIATGALVYSHILVSWFTNHYSAILAPLNFPIIILLDLLATNISAYRYEFGKVVWKGRVVNPRLKVYKKLPNLD